MDYKTFILEFIECYRSLPALWNIESEGYRNRNVKNRQYQTLLKKYREYYPDATKKEMTNKINSLRSSFRRELKRIVDLECRGSQLNEENKPTLFYFDALEFVRQSVMLQDSKSNTSTKNENAEHDEEELNEVNEPTKKRMKSSPVEKTIVPVENRLKQPKNEFRIIADFWANKLEKLDDTQRIFAEKFINEILFEAQLGTLHINAMQLNVSSEALIPTSQREQCAFKQNKANNPAKKLQNKSASVKNAAKRKAEIYSPNASPQETIGSLWDSCSSSPALDISLKKSRDKVLIKTAYSSPENSMDPLM